jgi:hypothetical protein
VRIPKGLVVTLTVLVMPPPASAVTTIVPPPVTFDSRWLVATPATALGEVSPTTISPCVAVDAEGHRVYKRGDDVVEEIVDRRKQRG